MKNVFSASRFVQLFSKHTLENYKKYLLSLAVLAGILVIGFIYLIYLVGVGAGPEFQYGLFCVFFLLSGTIFTSMIFSDLGNKRKSISMLTLPASNFEKYLVAWVYSFLIFQLAFVGCFYIVDFFMPMLKMGNKHELINVFSTENNYNQVFIAFAVMHAVFIFGAVFFEKMHFVKSSFVLFIFLGFIAAINTQMISLLIDARVLSSGPFSGLNIKEGEEVYYMGALPAVRPILMYLLAAICLALWTGTYFKLKEKEV